MTELPREPSGPVGLSNPLLIWDGDCGFCRRWIARWQRATGDRIDYAPYQQVHQRFPEIREEAFREAVHLILPNGAVLRGAEAVVTALASGRRRSLALWAYQHLPGAAAVSESTYRLVARQRRLLSRLGL